MAKKKTKNAAPPLLEYDEELSKQFSKGSKAKQCFNNCAMLFASPEKLKFPAERALYVEGMAGSGPSFHHAWIELDGKIVDPTRYVLGVKGHDNEITQYEPKVRLTQAEICASITQDQVPVWDYFSEMINELVKKNPALRDDPQIAAILGKEEIEAGDKPKAARKRKPKKDDLG